MLLPPLLTLVLFTSTFGQNNEGDDQKPYQPALVAIMKTGAKPNVAGGEMVRAQSVPWLVAIFKKQEFHCGGVIVDKYHVLTAERCVYPPEMVGWFTVVAGESYIMCREGSEQIRSIDKILAYATGNNPAKAAGIILLKLDEPLAFDGYEYGINRADLVGQSYTFPAKGEAAYLSGWGETSETDPLAGGVRQVTVQRADQTECKNRYSGEELEHMVCFGSSKPPYPSGCKGDRGSPLECGARREVCGIAIHTESCGKKGEMDLYVNLVPYISWIYTQTGNSAPEDRYPKHNETFDGLGTCVGYIQANSGVITLQNFYGGHTCTFVLKTKFKHVRIRILESTLLYTDRIAAGTLCHLCTEVVMDPLLTNVDHNITQGSLVMVQVIGGAGNQFSAGQTRGLKFLFSASGFPEQMQGFDEIQQWTAHIPSSVSYPPGGGEYSNNKRALLIFSPDSNAKKHLKITFNRFDVVNDDNPFKCTADYVEFYYTKWRDDYWNNYGTHYLIGRYCNKFPPPADFKYLYGHGFIIFRSDELNTGKGFDFSYKIYGS